MSNNNFAILVMRLTVLIIGVVIMCGADPTAYPTIMLMTIALQLCF